MKTDIYNRPDTLVKRITVLLLLILAIFVLTGCGSEAGKIYDRAVEYFEAGQYDEANIEFMRAIELDPEEEEYHIGYGMSLICVADYEKAREEFLGVIKDSDKKAAKKINKQAYRGIALSYYESGAYDQAKAYFNLALNTDVLSELDNDLIAYQANCEMFLNNYDGAAKEYTKLLDNTKGMSKEEIASYYLGRANAYALLEKYDEAIEDYKEVIDKDKKCYSAYLGEYFALLNTGNTEAAGQVLDEALEIKVKSTEDKYYNAVFLFYKGEYDTASKLLDECVDEGYTKARFYIGRIYQEKGDYQAAIDMYQAYIGEYPTERNADFCNQLAGCYMAIDEYDKAIELLEEGCVSAGGTMKKQIMFNRVIAYEKTGKYKKAKTLAEEYLETYDDSEMIKEYEFIKTRYRK